MQWNIRRFRFLHSNGAFFGGGILPPVLDIQIEPPWGSRAATDALNAANFKMSEVTNRKTGAGVDLRSSGISWRHDQHRPTNPAVAAARALR